LDDLKGMARVGRKILRGEFGHTIGPRRRMAAELPKGMAHQIPAFAVIGVVSTAAQLALYSVLRLALPPLAANALSLLITTVGNTAANRRFTFGVTGQTGAVRHQLQGGVTFAVGLGLSTGALALLDLVAPGASQP